MGGTRHHGGGDGTTSSPTAAPPAAAAVVAAPAAADDAAAAAAPAPAGTPPPAPPQRVVLPPDVPAVACLSCGVHLAKADDLVSKNFTGRHGRAYLYRNTINTAQGESEEHMLDTGMHTVADLSCAACGSVVGWHYLAAVDPVQAYKVGSSILEKNRTRLASRT